MNVMLKILLRPAYHGVRRCVRDAHIWIQTKRLFFYRLQKSRPRIYYLGVTEHANLGDLAQYFCIGKWLRKYYAEYTIVEFESSTVVDPRFGFINKLGRLLKQEDLIFFQSGYSTQDLGGDHELMHRLIIDQFSDVRIVMMPQTVFFRLEENKRRTALSYNQGKRLLFLARDRVSFEMASEMFPDVAVRLYPDIVTSLIGHYHFTGRQDRVLFCCRNDTEKYYSDDEIAVLRQKVEQFVPTDLSDTTIPVNYRKIRRNLQSYIEREVSKFSSYRLTITDRYHGTIYSLAANTPVIVIKTTDHKVTTGVEWFKGVYDDHVYLAQSLEHAFDLAKEILSRRCRHELSPFFDTQYYGKLRMLIEETVG